MACRTMIVTCHLNRHKPGHLPAWMREGTPTGIEKYPEDAGICPRIEQSVEEAAQRPLIFGGEKFLNNESFGDSADADKLLLELAQAGDVE